MKTVTVVAGVKIVLVLVACTQAGVSLIMNGSFEQDDIVNDIVTKAPRFWCDVNVPSEKFGGWITTDWRAHGSYSLSLYSTFTAFVIGDMASVSQQVYLTDVNEIIFDLKLGTIAGYPWDPSKRSAVVLIDGDVIWDSNELGPAADGEYPAQRVDVGEIYKDANTHTLSLALRSNANAAEWIRQFLARWDFVKFDAHCGGFGYLPGDLNHDCYVDTLDLQMLAETWLKDERFDLFRDANDTVDLRDLAVFASCWQDYVRHRSACRACDFDRSGAIDLRDLRMFTGHWLQWAASLPDLNGDEAVDFGDFAVLADGWLGNTDWKNWSAGNCFEMERPPADLNDDGIVNWRDFAALTGSWMNGGSCLRSDIDRSGSVDGKDLSQITNQWLAKSWIYVLK